MSSVLSQFPILMNILLFLILAAVVWISGSRLAYLSNVAAGRLGISTSLMGLLFLSTTTSLPEIATTVSAVIDARPRLALNNLYGGIALQTAVLAAADIFARGAISNYPRKANHALEATLLVSLLSLSIIVVVIGEPIVIWNVGLGSFFVLVFYCSAIFLLRKYDDNNDWIPVDLQEVKSNLQSQSQPDQVNNATTRRVVWMNIAYASVIFIAGVSLVQTSVVISEQSGIGMDIMGVVFLAGATSLPELSTTLAAVRLGAYTLAISNIFGSNLIMVGLVFPADFLFRQGAILSFADKTVQLAAALGILVTSAYLIGLLIRRKPRVGRMGLDSVFVLVVYIGSLGLYWILR
ncbi:sodium:calcium antiporter [Lentilitoribacter sp. EG35]|uniref:sodium:calcium antiporter n=1 Tax=Lentilitoribacter sp. EG35 TaxID=3234192 RepID=UPI003460C26D